MTVEKKLAQAGEHLKEVDAALQHMDEKLAGAEQKLTAKVVDQAVPSHSGQQPPTPHPTDETPPVQQAENV